MSATHNPSVAQLEKTAMKQSLSSDIWIFSAMPSQSQEQFAGQLELVNQLISVHGQVQQGRGRRHQQDAIHRAGVVMTVAAWQAYLEKISLEFIEVVENSLDHPADGIAPPDWAKLILQTRKTAAKQEIGRFNTPNCQNARSLLKNITGFDPWPIWEWHQGPRQWNGHDTRIRTDAWVRIRHTIAHGYELPADLDFLLGQNGQPRLTLKLLQECVKHFKHLVRLSDQGVSTFLADTHAIDTGW